MYIIYQNFLLKKKGLNFLKGDNLFCKTYCNARGGYRNFSGGMDQGRLQDFSRGMDRIRRLCLSFGEFAIMSQLHILYLCLCISQYIIQAYISRGSTNNTKLHKISSTETFMKKLNLALSHEINSTLYCP